MTRTNSRSLPQTRKSPRAGYSVRKQSVHVEFRLRADVHLAVRDGRNGELYGDACRVAIVGSLRTVPKCGVNTVRVKRVQHGWGRRRTSPNSPEDGITGSHGGERRRSSRMSKRLARDHRWRCLELTSGG